MTTKVNSSFSMILHLKLSNNRYNFSNQHKKVQRILSKECKLCELFFQLRGNQQLLAQFIFFLQAIQNFCSGQCIPSALFDSHPLFASRFCCLVNGLAGKRNEETFTNWSIFVKLVCLNWVLLLRKKNPSQVGSLCKKWSNQRSTVFQLNFFCV